MSPNVVQFISEGPNLIINIEKAYLQISVKKNVTERYYVFYGLIITLKYS